ncbi:Ribosomal protein L37 [Spironucleus salmonicida]|uniref:Ribosomal protein L37 n=1 Tax=Spironucleus salmonicida TaxID=348837 RepID=V6LB41_9EUKA|nr:Ribosomal protein L37 [Spironucleus salmonicida]|eukprot:EST41637.1 Ribosomal protein L37 [Spironucleus salmonicida]
MTKGTQAQGKRHSRLHETCPRCGKHSLHIQKGQCASCAFPQAHMRKYNWSQKALARRTQGTGRMSHLRLINQKFHAGNL